MTLGARGPLHDSLKQNMRKAMPAAVLVAGLLCMGKPSLAQNAQAPSLQPALEQLERQLESLSSRASEAVNQITQHALSLIGVRYKFGSENPERGLDCSGLVRHVFQQATGIILPRSAREQAKVGTQVAIHELQPGDLVFFNTRRFQFSHVGLYLGNNEFIHAPSRGKVVEVVRLDQPYWLRAFNGARRVIDAVPALAAASLATPAHASSLPPPSQANPAAPAKSLANPGGGLPPTPRLIGNPEPPSESRFAE